ncbi:MAG: ComF family protein [Bernardetiaceae bacterium]
MNWSQTWLNDFVHLLFPAFCLSCEAGIERNEALICTTCRLTLPVTDHHTHPENEIWQRFVGRVPIWRAQSYLYFRRKTNVQHLLHQLKYNNHPEIALLLGQWYGNVLATTDLPQSIDLIAPVPLHPTKRKIRGYNQSDGFAQGLSERLGIPWMPDLLLRTAHLESQTKKDRLHRFATTQGLFVVPKPDLVADKHLLIVDDVLTTGATLESCAQAALNAQAAKVSLATIAAAMG